jgi:hypothetical protein
MTRRWMSAQAVELDAHGLVPTTVPAEIYPEDNDGVRQLSPTGLFRVGLADAWAVEVNR